MDYFSMWQWIGIALFAWVIWDLFSGSVYLHRKIRRDTEFGFYWITMFLWTTVAASCFMGGYYI